MSIPEDQPSVLELIELSALRPRSSIQPASTSRSSKAWTAALPADWASAEGVADLRDRLSDVTDAVRDDGDAALLEVLSGVIVYLAVHPGRRRVQQAVVGEALGEEYGEELPDEIAGWLARQGSPAAEMRRHGARQPRRHFHARPGAPEDG